MANALFRRLGIAGRDSLGRVNYTPASGHTLVSMGGRSVQSPSTPTVIQRARSVVRYLVHGPETTLPIVPLTFPGLGPAAPIGAVEAAPTFFGTLVKGFTGAKNLVTKNIFTNPFTQFGKYAGNVGAIIGIEATFKGARQLATGDTFNPIPSWKGFGYALLGGVSRVGALAGGVFGLGQLGYRKTEQVTNKVITDYFTPNTPLPNVPDINLGQPNFVGGDTYLSIPPAPAASYEGPSFTPSLSISGGGGGNEFLFPLLALAAGGGLGYLLGRRKKYKRKKHRKKHGRGNT